MDGGGGPTVDELLRLLDQCDLSNSLCSTPCQSPFVGGGGADGGAAAVLPRIKTTNQIFLNQMRDRLMQSSATSGGAAASPSTSAGAAAASATGHDV